MGFWAVCFTKIDGYLLGSASVHVSINPSPSVKDFASEDNKFCLKRKGLSLDHPACCQPSFLRFLRNMHMQGFEMHSKRQNETLYNKNKSAFETLPKRCSQRKCRPQQGILERIRNLLETQTEMQVANPCRSFPAIGHQLTVVAYRVGQL